MLNSSKNPYDILNITTDALYDLSISTLSGTDQDGTGYNSTVLNPNLMTYYNEKSGNNYSIPVYRLHGSFNTPTIYDTDLRGRALDPRFLLPFASPCLGEIAPGVHRGYQETIYDFPGVNTAVSAVGFLYGAPGGILTLGTAITSNILEGLFFDTDCINIDDNEYYSFHLFYNENIQNPSHPLYADVPTYALSWGNYGLDGDGLVLTNSASADDLFTGKFHGDSKSISFQYNHGMLATRPASGDQVNLWVEEIENRYKGMPKFPWLVPVLNLLLS